MDVQSVEDSINVIVLNISGKRFEVSAEELLRLPVSKLGKLMASRANIYEPKTFFFSRPSAAFEEILAYYQTGELHMPSHVCPKAFKRELDFWEVSPDDMENCCRFKYLAFIDDFETQSAFQASVEMRESTKISADRKTPIGKFRARLWSILEHEEASFISKTVMWFLVFCVTLSIINLALGTVDELKTRIDLSTLRNYLIDLQIQEGEYLHDIVDLLYATDCHYDSWECVIEEFESYTAAAKQDNETSFTVGGSEFSLEDLDDTLDKFKTLDQYKERPKSIYFIDVFLLGVFTSELILRLCSCPSLKRYFFNLLNIIDIVVTATAYAEMIVENRAAQYRYADKGIKVLYYLQMLRVLRVLRFVNKMPSVRVLGFTIRSSFKDLAMLLVYLLVGVTIFSNFVYFAEDKNNFKNIPESWWWGIITMTTVGYGDVVPKTALGKICGCVCAIAGVLSLSLTIPLFVNTFIALYQFSHIYQRYLKPPENKVVPQKT